MKYSKAKRLQFLLVTAFAASYFSIATAPISAQTPSPEPTPTNKKQPDPEDQKIQQLTEQLKGLKTELEKQQEELDRRPTLQNMLMAIVIFNLITLGIGAIVAFLMRSRSQSPAPNTPSLNFPNIPSDPIHHRESVPHSSAPPTAETLPPEVIPTSEPAKRRSTKPSLIEEYNQNPKAFCKRKSGKHLAESQSSIEERLSGRSVPPVLEASSTGQYFVIQTDSAYAELFPKEKRMSEYALKSALSFFNVDSQRSSSQKFELRKPAKVRQVDLDRWELVEPGIIEFL